MRKLHASIPAGDHIIDQQVQKMIDLVSRRLVWTRDNPCQIHVFRLIPHVLGKVQAYTGYDATRSHHVMLSVTLDIEKVYI